MESERLKQLSSALQQDLAELFIQFGQKHFRGVLLSVTKVRVSSDLSIARVYVSIFPLTDKETAMQLIEEHKGAFKSGLSKRNGSALRKMPELFFHLDDSLDHEEEIDRLIRGEGENPIK